MRIHNGYVTIQTTHKREFLNLTPNVRDAAEKSGIRDGVIFISSLHSNCGIFINDEEQGLLTDIEEWASRLAPSDAQYKHKGESIASAHLQGLLLNQQVFVSVAEGKLELGPWQQVIYAELDGQRPKRILIKILGE